MHVKVDDTAAHALTSAALRVSVDTDGNFDPSFPTTVPLVDEDGDGIFEAATRVRIAPERVVGGTTSETFPYIAFVAQGGTDYPNVGAQIEALDELAVDALIHVGNPDLVPVTFRVDASKAYLNAAGTLRGVGPGEAVFLTGEFSTAEDAFGQNASDAFTGGENVVLEMQPSLDLPGVWQRTLFLPPSRPYGWKAVRCPKGLGCAEINRHVTSSGRAFATVMKNLVTENRDAQTVVEVKVLDPRTPQVDNPAGGAKLDYTNATVFVGAGTGPELDPSGTPDGRACSSRRCPTSSST